MPTQISKTINKRTTLDALHPTILGASSDCNASMSVDLQNVRTAIQIHGCGESCHTGLWLGFLRMSFLLLFLRDVTVISAGLNEDKGLLPHGRSSRHA